VPVVVVGYDDPSVGFSGCEQVGTLTSEVDVDNEEQGLSGCATSRSAAGRTPGTGLCTTPRRGSAAADCPETAYAAAAAAYGNLDGKRGREMPEGDAALVGVEQLGAGGQRDQALSSHLGGLDPSGSGVSGSGASTQPASGRALGV
jgi:hypothetical protein